MERLTRPCAECDANTNLNDYLCEICRLIEDNAHYSLIPPGHWDTICEHCGTKSRSTRLGRFLGLCDACKEVARRSANTYDADAYDKAKRRAVEVGVWEDAYRRGYDDGRVDDNFDYYSDESVAPAF